MWKLMEEVSLQGRLMLAELHWSTVVKQDIILQMCLSEAKICFVTAGNLSWRVTWLILPKSHLVCSQVQLLGIRQHDSAYN